MALLHCQGIKKHYRHKHALHGLDLDVKAGEAVGLLGINGAGKSTTIKILLGLVRKSAGSVALEESQVGFLPELARMPEHITPRNFVALALRIRGKKASEADAALAETGLGEEHMSRHIRLLSKGLRQRVALAYALAGSPRLIVLDEPMSGLDAIGRIATLELLKKRKMAGAGILICSHIVPDLVRLTDKVLLIHQGEVKQTFSMASHDMDEVVMLEQALRDWSSQ